MHLVLSLFPGIGLLDQAFEEQGFCVVRGPDLLWGGDIKNFHPPSGKFDGVIGGPPCQAFSQLAHLIKHRYGQAAVAENLIPEFERCVAEAQPLWFLMENVRAAPLPIIAGYAVTSALLNNRSFGATQNRVRRFSFGIAGDTPAQLLPHIEAPAALEPLRFDRAVLASHRGSGYLKKSGERYPRKQLTLARMTAANNRTPEDLCELQGLPRDTLKHAPFTREGKNKVIGNGVPLPMGRAIAKAVKQIVQGATA